MNNNFNYNIIAKQHLTKMHTCVKSMTTFNQQYMLGQEKKMSWFWSSGGSVLTQVKKKCGPQNKYNTEKNTESRIFFTCQSSESMFICFLSCYMNVLSTGLIWISSFKTFWTISFGIFMLWFKKKRKKVHRATGPIFKNQLTRTKVFFFPGLRF